MAAGTAANLFMWWYGKPELIVMAAITLAWLISCLQKNVLTLIAGTTTFLALSGIASFDPLSSPYLKDVFVTAGFIFPNTLETITEIQKEGLQVDCGVGISNLKVRMIVAESKFIL